MSQKSCLEEGIFERSLFEETEIEHIARIHTTHNEIVVQFQSAATDMETLGRQAMEALRKLKYPKAEIQICKAKAGSIMGGGPVSWAVEDYRRAKVSNSSVSNSSYVAKVMDATVPFRSSSTDLIQLETEGLEALRTNGKFSIFISRKK
jgi:hypothetical protein